MTHNENVKDLKKSSFIFKEMYFYLLDHCNDTPKNANEVRLLMAALLINIQSSAGRKDTTGSNQYIPCINYNKSHAQISLDLHH